MQFYNNPFTRYLHTYIPLAITILIKVVYSSEIIADIFRRHKMRNFLLIALAVAVVGVSVSDACSCMPTHPQTTYCNAEFGKRVD